MDSPRGRIYLMKGLVEKKIELTDKVRGHFDACLGCMSCVTACPSGVNEATIRVLNAEGYDVVLPEGQGCCGALSLHVGREDESKALAGEMIELCLHDRVDAVVINSAGCGSHMKTLGRLFRDEPEYAERAHRFDVLVKDVTEFLAGIEPLAERHPVRLRAAMHDACHLRHAQRIIEQPRKLLGAIPGLTLLEVPDAEQCCGSAGVYNLIEPESADQIGTRKVENVLSLSPELLVSGNPACTLQIQAKLRDRGLTPPALHPVEPLDRSIRGEERPER